MKSFLFMLIFLLKFASPIEISESLALRFNLKNKFSHSQNHKLYQKSKLVAKSNQSEFINDTFFIVKDESISDGSDIDVSIKVVERDKHRSFLKDKRLDALIQSPITHDFLKPRLKKYKYGNIIYRLQTTNAFSESTLAQVTQFLNFTGLVSGISGSSVGGAVFDKNDDNKTTEIQVSQENTPSNASTGLPDESLMGDHAGKCFVKIHNLVFDLNPLDKAGPFEFKSKSNKNIMFNICEAISTDCLDKTALIVNKPNCLRIGGKDSQYKKWQLRENKEQNYSFLNLTLEEGDICPYDSTLSYTVNYLLICDENAEEAKVLTSSDFNLQNCHNNIQMRTKHACPKEAFFPWPELTGVPKTILILILVVGGFYYLFFGNYFYELNCSVLIGLFAFIALRLTFAPMIGLSVFASAILSLVIGYMVYSLQRCMFNMLAILIGYMVGNMLFNYLRHIFTGLDPNVIYYICVIVAILVMLLLAYFINKMIITLATSLVGAYSVVRGVSLVFGGFPDEMFVMMLFDHNEYAQIEGLVNIAFYIYVGAILLLFLIGLLYQSGILGLFSSGDSGAKSNADKEEVKENIKDID